MPPLTPQLHSALANYTDVLHSTYHRKLKQRPIFTLSLPVRSASHNPGLTLLGPEWAATVRLKHQIQEQQSASSNCCSVERQKSPL